MADQFTLLNTRTQGEIELRDEMVKLQGTVETLINAVIGLTVVLSENGIDVDPEATAAEFDDVLFAAPPDPKEPSHGRQ